MIMANGKGYTGYGYITRNGDEIMEFATEDEAVEYMREIEEDVA